MSKSKIIIGALAFLALAGVTFFIFNKDSQEKLASEINKLNPEEGVMCTQTVAVDQDDNAVTSTFYILNNKIRYDSSLATEVQGQKDVHMISDGQYNYLWGQSIIPQGIKDNKVTQGFKIKHEEAKNSDDELIPDIDLEELKKNNFQIPGLECKQWTPDPSLFVLPKNIEFISVEDMFNSAISDFNQRQSESGAVNMDACDACEMMPDNQAKSECQKSCQEDK